MRIVAKEKDYYDYLQGVYGVDDKLVYDRRDGEVWDFLEDGMICRVLINGTAYVLIYLEGRFRNDLDAFLKFSNTKLKGIGSNSLRYSRIMSEKGMVKFYDLENKNKVSINKDLREPVLINWFNLYREGWSKEFDKPFLLNDFNFASVLNPHETYIEISSFLGWSVDNPPLPDKQTNKEKITSHGFDLKTSFRHRK